MRFYVGAFLFLFVFSFSIYGLFVEEIKIGFGDSSFMLKGWAKNGLCIIGLAAVLVISVYPILLALSNAFKNGGK